VPFWQPWRTQCVVNEFNIPLGILWKFQLDALHCFADISDTAFWQPECTQCLSI
jgi:hypothetical protein